MLLRIIALWLILLSPAYAFKISTNTSGETGPQGEQGVAGAAGADGRDGDNGTDGADGMARICKALENPTDSDAIEFDTHDAAWTLRKVTGYARGGTSVVFTVQECDSAGANCAGVHAAKTITSGNAVSSPELTDTAIAQDGILKLDIGTVTGDVLLLLVCIYQ